MLGDDVAGLDDGSVADLIAATRRRAVEAETELLVLAGVWGHRAEIDPDAPTRADGSVPGPGRRPGGEGTPTVDMDAVIEFGTLTHTTTIGAAHMIADALDLEHRLPQVWQRVCRGEIAAWKARIIAKRVRHLSATAAGYVDRAVVGYVASLPWGRLQDLVEAKVIEADPFGAEARASAAEAERFVRTGRTTEHGLKTIFARVDAGDAIWFVAAVDRIAAILAEDSDTDPVDVRRSKAIGVLADPAMAAQMIATHRRPRPATAPSPTDESPSADESSRDESPCADPETGADERSPAAADASCRWSEPTDPPQSEEAWPQTDPWERHRWIPQKQWEAAHRRHPDDPGPDEPGSDDAGQAAVSAETGRGRAGDPARAGDVLAGLLDDRAVRHLLAPTAIVHLHLSADALATSAVRAEEAGCVGRMEGAGPVTIDQVRRFLGSGRVNVTVKPVIDLNDRPPAVDAWEIPVRIRERTRLRMPAEVFPWAASTGMRPDLDHTIAYRPPDRGGPPGQTSETKLGPLGRTQHNAKTRGRWRCRQPVPGVFVWRSPHGQTLIVDPDGSHDYGRGRFAWHLWEAAVGCSDVDRDQADAEWACLGVPLREIGRLRRAA